MSSLDVYLIGRDGVVDPNFIKLSNAHACAPWIWTRLAEKYGVADPMKQMRANLHAVWELWELWQRGALDPTDDLLFAFTSDASWVRLDHLPMLVEALKLFWDNRPMPRDDQVDDTIPRLCQV